MTSSELIPAKPRRLDAGSVALLVATFVAIGGLAFAAGRLTAPASAAAGGAARSGFTGAGAFGGAGGAGTGGTETGGAAGQGGAPGGSFAPGAGGVRGGFGGGLFGTGGGLTVSGTVTAVNSSSITLKLASGTTIDVPIDSTTTYHSQASATSSDVKVGGQVSVELGDTTGAGAGRAFGGQPAASPAAGAGAGTGTGTGGGAAPASGAPSSPNPGDFLARLGPARSVTIVKP